MSGWLDHEPVTISYRTLRMAQQEAAAEREAEIVKMLEERFRTMFDHEGNKGAYHVGRVDGFMLALAAVKRGAE